MVVSSVSASLMGVTYADSLNAVAAGNRVTYRSTDGGQSWSLTWSPAAVLWDVTAASDQVVVAVGNPSSSSLRGIVYHSTDCGVQWDSVVVASGAELLAVSFCSPDTGFTLSSKGGIYRTVDGGRAWDSVAAMPLGAGVTSIAASSPRNGAISGNRGMVYYTSKGFVGVSEAPRLPDQPALYQNFPNPFNPSTRIRYALTKSSFVTLTIFNALGQEVALLLHGEEQPGYHEVKFDASTLSSGMYLYRLTAGNFIESRKLLLLR
jgi:photosystem II stability/assembly factor-like uncharacterized protein